MKALLSNVLPQRCRIVVFINGPFGVGKTTTAAQLAGLVNGVLFDPEQIGSALVLLFGKLWKVADFQEYPAWTFLTVELTVLLAALSERPILVPMTVWHQQRWDYISKRLSSSLARVLFVRLVCSESTLRSRILSRPDCRGSHQWCLQHFARGIRLMNCPQFGMAVNTENKSPQQVADLINGEIANYLNSANETPEV